MTGGIGFVGEAMNQGIQIAVEEANAQGGINGEKIELMLEDSKSDPKEANNAVAKLLEVDKIKILLGPARSGSVLASKPLVAKANAVMVKNTVTWSVHTPNIEIDVAINALFFELSHEVVETIQLGRIKGLGVVTLEVKQAGVRPPVGITFLTYVALRST